MHGQTDKLKPRLGLPHLGLGVGLRSTHFEHLLRNPPVVDWFEIISENFIENYGFARHVLDHVRAQVPVVMHGVSLSIGSTDPLNVGYLEKLKELARQVEPQWISDHLCWTGVAHVNTHDLLPMPLTEQSLAHVVSRVHQVQEFLQRPIVLENPSTYVQFRSNTMHEWEFLSALAVQTGCGLLLDVNNVYVSAFNHGFDPEQYIRSLPHEHIVQMHLAGPADCGNHMIDTHDSPVPRKVWELYALASSLTGSVSTLLEWDAAIPPYDVLVAEVMKAKNVLSGMMPEVGAAATGRAALSNPLTLSLQHAHE